VGGLAIAWVVFMPTADWIATHDVGPVTGALRTLRLQTARDAARGRLLTLGAGLFAAGALWFTGRNFTLSRRTVELTEQWQRRTFELTEEGQVTDRYTKAIEQLGSDKLDVRIGGIYALERVARDSARDQPTVMDVLAAFVREHSREEEWHGADGKPATRPDVQAAITVIGRRDTTHDRGQINLADASLPGARLIRAHLHGATLYRADLTGAVFMWADLSNTVLYGANLTSAIMVGSNLSHAVMTEANLTDANLSTADLSHAALAGADLMGANLAQANLREANLLSRNLDRTDFTGADLLGANLSRAARIPDGWIRDPDSKLLRRPERQSP
jgi:Pentapeptide repeats (8 copies)